MKTSRTHALPLLLILLLMPAACKFGDKQDTLLSRATQTHTRTYLSNCTQCHSSTNYPELDPLATGGSGTSGKHLKHVSGRGIACERCHDGYMSQSAHMNGVINSGNPGINIVRFGITGTGASWTGDTGPQTGGCASVSCHGLVTMDWYEPAAWSTPATCASCHTSAIAAELDPFATNGIPPAGRHVKHVSSRGIGCDRCHHNYPTQLTHMNGVLDTVEPSVNIVSFNITGPSGGWVNDSGAQTGGCSNVACHAADTVQWYGASTWTLPTACTACHVSSFSTALDPLATNGAGIAGKHARHVSSLAQECVKCHQGYTGKVTHSNGTLDTPNPAVLIVSFDATNPTGTWSNDSGAETGDCSSLACHGTDSPAWYAAAGWTLPPCAACHDNTIGARRQVMGTGGDFAANPAISSRHVAGGNDPTSAQCLTCHDLSAHAAGTVRLKNADTGASIAYAPLDPKTLEPFCLSCHDTAGAVNEGLNALSPFADGGTLGVVPNVAGNKIAGYWTAANTAHKNNGLTCAGTGAPNTGCHGNNQKINMHGSASKGLLTRNLTLPVPASSAYDYNQYKLCFDCHESYPAVTKEVVLGYKQGGNYDVWWAPSPFSSPTISIQSLFRDRYISSAANYPPYWSGQNQAYNNNFWGDPYTPLHNYHLSDADGWMQNIWKYRGKNTETGRATCVTCHNVHGTDSPVRSTYSEFGITAFTGTGGDLYKKLVPDGNYEDAVLKAYPIYCFMSCHSMLPGTSYWHTPANE